MIQREQLKIRKIQNPLYPGSRSWKIELANQGQTISYLWIIDRWMRIGEVPVKIGGINSVFTESRFRKKGYASAVMNAAIDLMKREGYDASLLYGFYFYQRFGYVTCMPSHRLVIDTIDADDAKKKLKIRRMRASDVSRMIQLYDRDNAQRTGSALRKQGIWTGFPRWGSSHGRKGAVRVAVNKKDQVQGYVVYDDVKEFCWLAEVGGQGEAVFSTLLNFLAKRAIRLRKETISLRIPGDHPFAIYCRHFGYQMDTRYVRDYDAMGRIINFDLLMEKLLPEFARRWAKTDRRESLSISTDLGSCSLRYEGDTLKMFSGRRTKNSICLRQEDLMHLLLGYQRPIDLYNSGRLTMPNSKAKILHQLFPLQEAHMWPADRF